MNPRRLILSLTYQLVTSSIVLGEGQCPGNVVPLKYHSLGRSHIALQATVNHSGPYEFIVDTGSQITIIEPSLAAELQLESAGVVSVVAGVQRAVTGLVSPEVIAAGPYAVHQPLVVVESLAQLRALYPGMRGILGEDFLMGFDLLIDSGKKILCLDPTSGMRQEIRGERVSMVRQGGEGNDTRIAHRILIPVQLPETTSRTMNMWPDSGANSPVLFVSHSGQTAWIQRLRMPRGRVAGESAEFLTMMDPQEIRIGKHVVSNVAFAFPVNSNKNVIFAGEDGLLPTSLFKRVFISYSGGFVVLDPR